MGSEFLLENGYIGVLKGVDSVVLLNLHIISFPVSFGINYANRHA